MESESRVKPLGINIDNRLSFDKLWLLINAHIESLKVILETQSTFTCSKLITETLEQSVK